MASKTHVRTALLAVSLTLALLSSGVATAASDAVTEAEGSHATTDEESAAQEGSQDTEAPAPPPPAPGGQSGLLSKLQIHGFLTQAFATTRFQKGRFPTPTGAPAGPTAEEISLGIPENGTTNYRNLAIQFRYDITPKDTMIIQLSSRALGDSPINDIEDEVELDWAFYEHRFRNNTSVKIGRVQIPYGIFNEIRDVGTILPFYRPSFNFYREGSFTSETVDGIDISHSFFAARDWSLDTDVYFGEWDTFDLDPFSELAVPARNEDSYGGQVWLNTPLSGLRWGLGYQKKHTVGGAEGVVREPGTSTTFRDWLTSIDAVFDRFVVRAEYFNRKNKSQPFPVLFSPDFRATFESYYLQLGYHITNRFRVYLQQEVTDINAKSIVFTETQDFTQREDLGIALNVLFSASLVLKAEYHEVEGEDQGFIPVFGPGGLRLQPIYAQMRDGNYTIISFSASF